MSLDGRLAAEHLDDEAGGALRLGEAKKDCCDEPAVHEALVRNMGHEAGADMGLQEVSVLVDRMVRVGNGYEPANWNALDSGRAALPEVVPRPQGLPAAAMAVPASLCPCAL